MQVREYNFLLSIRYDEDEGYEQTRSVLTIDEVQKIARERMVSGLPSFGFKSGGFDIIPITLPRDQIEAGLHVSLAAREFHEGWRALWRRVVGDRPVYVAILAGVIIASTFAIVELARFVHLLKPAAH